MSGRLNRLVAIPATTLPLFLEFRSAGEGFLGSHLGGGKGGIEVGATQRLALGQPFRQENHQAADKSVAGAGRVLGLHFEGGNHLQAIAAHEQTRSEERRVGKEGRSRWSP